MTETTRKNLRLPDDVWQVVVNYQRKRGLGTLNKSLDYLIQSFDACEKKAKRLEKENDSLRTELSELIRALRQKKEADTIIKHLLGQKR